MKRFFLKCAVPIAAMGYILFGAGSGAARRACLIGEETFGLTPTGVVTLDGLILRRSTATGRFQTDGGLDFDVNTATLQAVDPVNTSCTNAAATVTLTVTDPFTGLSLPIGAVAP